MNLVSKRVELHKSSEAKDYETLHKKMENAGFWRTIKLKCETTIYHLPTAEYNFSSDNFSTKAVMELAVKVAKRTGLRFN